MNIQKATYGTLDVTDIIKKHVEDNFISIVASNDVFGDPNPGIVKRLEVLCDDKLYVVEENEIFRIGNIPKTKNTIGIVVVCTNAYFILGIRFIKRFIHFYNGKSKIKFFIFSDTCPEAYLPNVDFEYIKTQHKNWNQGTNSKFKNIISLEDYDVDYLYYFDADTNVRSGFDENWFLGDLVAGEHYGNNTWMKDNKPFERNSISTAYVPKDSGLEETYYYGAFFGGTKDNMISLCKILLDKQETDKKIGFEPCWNDESYINHYFHFNKPKVVLSHEFAFSVSDKGGIGETRNSRLDIEKQKDEILKNRYGVFDLIGGRVIFK